MLNVPVNNFSVMFGRNHRFLGITSTLGVNMSCSKTQNGDPSEARTPDPESEVLTTRPPRALQFGFEDMIIESDFVSSL